MTAFLTTLATVVVANMAGLLVLWRRHQRAERVEYVRWVEEGWR